MLKVINEVDVYEGFNADGSKRENSPIYIKSHWNESSKVVLIIDGISVTLFAKDLHMAIENAKNNKKY